MTIKHAAIIMLLFLVFAVVAWDPKKTTGTLIEKNKGPQENQAGSLPEYIENAELNALVGTDSTPPMPKIKKMALSLAEKEKQQSVENFIHRGYKFYQKRKFNLAKQNFEHALTLDPESAGAYHNLGLVAIAQGDLYMANHHFSKAIEANVLFDPPYTCRGRLSLEREQYEDALKDLNMAITLNPDKAEAFQLRGKLHQIKGYLDHAMADFNQVIALEPDTADGYIHKAEILVSYREWMSALNELTMAIALDPERGETFLTRAKLHQEVGEELKAFSDAETACTLGIKRACTKKAEILKTAKTSCQNGNRYSCNQLKNM